MRSIIYKLLNVRKFKHIFSRNLYGIDGKPVCKNRVNLEYWNRVVNLGDVLSPIIVDWMLQKRNIDKNKQIAKTKHLIAVGSIMDNGSYDCTVWGSGVASFGGIEMISIQSKYRKYDIRSVRGPITKQIMEALNYKCPSVYGDPAVLLPLIYKPIVKKKYSTSIIQHFREAVELPEEYHEICIQTDDYKFFIEEILASEKVISSSLHGIILAESYGIPAVFLNKGVDGELIKYYDWYYSTNRRSVMVANSIEEAIGMQPMSLPENIGEMQKNIMEAFPYDLWEK